VPKVVLVVAVGVINRMAEMIEKVFKFFCINHSLKSMLSACLMFGMFVCIPSLSWAALLPEDRLDVMYHQYDGGGVKIDGPSVLIRKSLLDKYSVSANYYVDNITGASIDVEILASSYKEERTEYSLGVDYLHNKTMMALGYTSSTENDYDAETVYGSISQDFFGDMTNISLIYSQGWDDVDKTDDDTFGKEEAKHRKYSLSISQILTKKLVTNIIFETDVDEGFLNNPYRQVRIVDGASQRWEDEVYPETRTSDAFALRFKYAMLRQSVLGFEFRHYMDSWGIDANNIDVNYAYPLRNWVLDVHYRYYSQDSADFYADSFQEGSLLNHMARDKELSEFSGETFGFGVTYHYEPHSWEAIEKITINFFYDHITFNYDDFLDARESVGGGSIPGQESAYSFDADVTRLFLSVWY